MASFSLLYTIPTRTGIGWKYTAERCLVCQIIPKGQDAELMGYYLFAGQILLWLPLLIFTVLNEKGVNMRIGIASVGGFFVAALVAYIYVGSYKEAVRIANEEEGEEENTASNVTNIDEEAAKSKVDDTVGLPDALNKTTTEENFDNIR